jgi:hypothetical protein
MGCNDYLFSYADNNNKYGILDKSGKKLGKAIYSSVNNSSYFGKYILVGIEKKAKKQRKNKSDDLYFDEYSYTPSTYGLVDLTGKMVLKAIYDDYNYSYGETSLIVLAVSGPAALELVLEEHEGNHDEMTDWVVQPIGPTTEVCLHADAEDVVELTPNVINYDGSMAPCFIRSRVPGGWLITGPACRWAETLAEPWVLCVSK